MRAGRTAYATAALTAALALWTSGAPSVVYPLYGSTWGIPASGTTAVFAAYPAALIVTLGLFGHAGDVLGRRVAITAGLVLMAVGTLAFALAPGFGVLLAGRAVTGFGVGMALGPATAGLREWAPPGREERAGSATTVSTASGLTVALVLGGAIVALLPDRLHTAYWPLLAVLLVAIVLALRLPAAPVGRLRPQLPHLPAAVRPVVVRGALAVSAAYATGSVVLALGADVATGLVRTSDPLVIGLLLGISSVVIGATALVARGTTPARMALIGAVAMLAGLAALLIAGSTASLAAFIAAIVLTGIAYSLFFAAGVGTVAAHAPAQHRAATLSAAYLVGYAVQAVTALALGAVATAAGLLTAIVVAVPVLSALAIVAAVALGLPRRLADGAPAAS